MASVRTNHATQGPIAGPPAISRDRFRDTLSALGAETRILYTAHPRRRVEGLDRGWAPSPVEFDRAIFPVLGLPCTHLLCFSTYRFVVSDCRPANQPGAPSSIRNGLSFFTAANACPPPSSTRRCGEGWERPRRVRRSEQRGSSLALGFPLLSRFPAADP